MLNQVNSSTPAFKAITIKKEEKPNNVNILKDIIPNVPNSAYQTWGDDAVIHNKEPYQEIMTAAYLIGKGIPFSYKTHIE